MRASVLYFVLNDLSTVDPMYLFSLDAYNDLFLISIRNSPKNDALAERIKSLNDYHTYGVYKYTARGLFERHKLLLSLQMCVRILQTANQVRGGGGGGAMGSGGMRARKGAGERGAGRRASRGALGRRIRLRCPGPGYRRTLTEHPIRHPPTPHPQSRNPIRHPATPSRHPTPGEC